MPSPSACHPTRSIAGPVRGRSSSRLRRRAAAVIAVAPLLLAIVPAGVARADEGRQHPQTTAYTETNAVGGNQIVALGDFDGSLRGVATYSAGGAGTGSGLGSQGAIVTADGFLFAVDAGSNQVSVFRIDDRGSLHRTDVVASGGVQPVSIAVHHEIVYVVNAGDSSITGFRLGDDGRLSPLGVHLILPGAGAAQISFDRTGSRLIVTQKATNTIDILPVTDGVAGPAVSHPSTGQTPFGFAVDRRNHLIVSNAAGGASGASSLTSYALTGPTGFTAISSTVPDTQTAACWVLLSGNGRFAYTTNTGSGTVSSYRVTPGGSLRLLEPVAASTGAGPIDIARAGTVLFTLNAGAHTVTTDLIGSRGQLTAGSSVSVPDGAVGLAVVAADADA